MRNLDPTDMRAVKLTPTGNIDEALILFLNENNTITDIEMTHIMNEFYDGKTEGETFGLAHAAGGIWQVVANN